MLLKWVGLSWLDRLLGGVFGLVRGLVFAIAVVLALHRVLAQARRHSPW